MQVDGEAVILNLSSHNYFGLNITATAIWDLVKKHPGVSGHDIVSALSQQFAQPPSTIADDVQQLLDALVSQQVVIAGPAATAPVPTVERSSRPYETPRLETFGALDTLILSGE